MTLGVLWLVAPNHLAGAQPGSPPGRLRGLSGPCPPSTEQRPYMNRCVAPHGVTGVSWTLRIRWMALPNWARRLSGE